VSGEWARDVSVSRRGVCASVKGRKGGGRGLAECWAGRACACRPRERENGHGPDEKKGGRGARLGLPLGLRAD